MTQPSPPGPLNPTPPAGPGRPDRLDSPDVEAMIAAVVAGAPPITSEQVEVLRRWMPPVKGTTPVATSLPRAA